MPHPAILVAAAVVYTLMSLLTFGLYALDKRAARRGKRRTPEATLHLFELLGGWPGALVAQQVVKHKRRKRGYMAVFVAIVALHFIVWLGVLYILNL